MNTSDQYRRRQFIRQLAGSVAMAATIGPLRALAQNSALNAVPEKALDNPASKPLAADRILRFHNTHTVEELHLTYWSAGNYVASNLEQLNYLLRDHRQHEAAVMDPALFDQLWAIQQIVGGTGVFEIISGYRSKKTNAMLRERSSKVASNSFHIQGRAIDLRLRGTDTLSLRDAAISLEAGGVGYYQSSDFIHVDTGPVRQWG